jgi:hypothetical protein
MNIVDRGSGPPLVLIPGLQGRWEYMRRAVDALASSFRVLTFSLDADDFDAMRRRSIGHWRQRASSARRLRRLVRRPGRGAVRGEVSDRCSALVLASTPKPLLRLRRRHQIYLRAPWILGPIFFAESPLRMGPEIYSAIPDARARRRFALDGLRTVLSAPISISRMAARARLITSIDLGRTASASARRR